MRRDRNHPWPYRLVRDIANADTSPLTPYELRVLVGFANGLRAREVAAVHGVAESTIVTQATNARRKLKAKTNAHAVAIAFRAGLIG